MDEDQVPWLPWQPALIPPLLFYRPFRLSSTTHYCSLSLSALPPFPHLSLSLYHFSLFSVEHRDTDAYIDLRNTEEKNLFSYSVLACYTAFASPFFPDSLPPLTSSLFNESLLSVFWFLLSLNPASIIRHLVRSYEKTKSGFRGWNEGVGSKKEGKSVCGLPESYLIRDSYRICSEIEDLRWGRRYRYGKVENLDLLNRALPSNRYYFHCCSYDINT